MNTKLIKILLGVVIFLVVLLLIFKFTDKDQVVVEEVVEDTTSACGIEVLSPSINSKVDTDFKVHVVVDNTKRQELGCGWIVFEGQAGVVRVYDDRGFSVGSGLLTTEEEWMNDGPTNFYSDIKIDITPNSNSLVFTIEEDDPAGTGVFDMITMPLYFSN